MAKKSKIMGKAKNSSNVKSNSKLTTKSTKKPAAKVLKNAKPAKKVSAQIAKKAKTKKMITAKTVTKKNVTTKPLKTQKTKATQIKSNNKTFSKPVAISKPTKAKFDFTKWVTPLDNRLLVHVSKESERMTPGGLYIPETVTDVSGNFKGTVVVIGRGHMDKKGKVRALDVQVGDKVVFSQFSGSKIEFQGETVIFIRESDILGIVNQ